MKRVVMMMVAVMMSAAAMTSNAQLSAAGAVADSVAVPVEESLNELPVVVDFFATWCGPCKLLAPVLDRVAARYAGRVVVERVDIDEYPDVANQVGIQGVPTLLFLKPDGTGDAIVGLPGEDEAAIEAALEEKFQFLLTR